jgi:hypothetical protein
MAGRGEDGRNSSQNSASVWKDLSKGKCTSEWSYAEVEEKA